MIVSARTSARSGLGNTCVFTQSYINFQCTYHHQNPRPKLSSPKVILQSNFAQNAEQNRDLHREKNHVKLTL